MNVTVFLAACLALSLDAATSHPYGAARYGGYRQQVQHRVDEEPEPLLRDDVLAKDPAVQRDDDEAAPAAATYMSGNTFFPITLGGYADEDAHAGDQPMRRPHGRQAHPGYHSMPAAAISNSFNMGKGGVASSRSVSYIDPNMMYRKQQYI